MTVRTWTAFVAMSAIWGSSYFFTHLALQSYGALTVVAARMAIAMSTLGLLVIRTPVSLPGRGEWAPLFGMGCINTIVPFVLLTWGQQFVPSSLAAVLSSSTPLFVVPLVALVSKSERITLPILIGTGLGYAGVIGMLSVQTDDRESIAITGSLAIVSSSVVYAVANLVSRHLLVEREHSALTLAFVQSAFATLILAPLALLLDHGGDTVALESMASLIWLGMLGSGLCYVLYFELLRVWGSVRTSMNTFVQPIVAVVLGVSLLGEAYTIDSALAGIVTVIGVGIVSIARYSDGELASQSETGI